MKRNTVDSDALESVGYEATILEIKFKKNPKIYQYYGVPEIVHLNLINSDSLGKFFNLNIRNKYHWKEVA